MLLNVSWQYKVHSTARVITRGNAFHHQSKNGYGDKIKLILTRVRLETELPFIYMGKQMISEYVCISERQGEESFFQSYNETGFVHMKK